MIGLVLPWALVAACAAAGAWAYALVRQERAAYRGRVLSDRGLYEAGEAAATERKKPKLPRLARALHEAGVETPAANWAAGVAAIAFVSLSLADVVDDPSVLGAVDVDERAERQALGRRRDRHPQLERIGVAAPVAELHVHGAVVERSQVAARRIGAYQEHGGVSLSA